MNMNNIDELSELTGEVSQLSEEIDALKKDYQETKDILKHWEQTWFEVKNTFYIAGVLVGFILLGAFLNLIIREWPIFLAGTIWLVGSVLTLWLIISIIRILTKGVARLFSRNKR